MYRDDEEWLREYGNYLKRRFPGRATAKHYVSDVRIFLKWRSGDGLQAVTPRIMAEFVDNQRAQDLSVATVNRRIAALKTFFDYVGEEQEGLKQENPVNFHRLAGRKPEHLPRDLSDAEVERLMSVIKGGRDQAMVVVMLYAGLRVGEVIDLCVKDIVIPEKADAPLQLRVMGKGRKERMVYLHHKLAKPLLDYLANQVPIKADEALFRNRLGKKLSVAGVEERIRYYAQLCGVAVTCHRLRHTYGRWMAEGEMPVLTLARLMGHTSLSVTQRYIDGADPQVRRHYENAMERNQQAGVVLETAPEPIEKPEINSGAPATIVRPEPDFHWDNWMPEWPDWLRQGCLDFVRHKWWQWKPSQRQKHATRTLNTLRTFWNWRLQYRPCTDWSNLSATDLNTYVDDQLARNLCAKSVQSILDKVFELLAYQVRQEKLSLLPPRPQIKLPDPLPQHLQPAEILAIDRFIQNLSAPSQDDLLDIALYSLLVFGGLRICEALDLQIKHLDLSAKRLRIYEGKNRKDRIVFLTQQAINNLQAYLLSFQHVPGDLLLQVQGHPLSYSQAWNRIRRLGHSAGVADLSPQRLRHTYATLLINNGMTLEGLQQLMGHEQITTTLIYARLSSQTVEHQYRAAMENFAP